MIVYSKSKKEFLEDVLNHSIEDVIMSAVEERLLRRVGKSEYLSWKNSLPYVANILTPDEIPSDAGVAIEYRIPRTSNRIDVIVSGQDAGGNDSVIIIELKQWSDAELTDKDGIVRTRLNSSMVETLHPSYQAWSYAALLEGFNETIYEEKITLKPCAYLHNYEGGDALTAEFYSPHLLKAPLFARDDKKELREFIGRHIKRGDRNNVLQKIQGGRIKPSKPLADSLASMMQGNSEFVMIDSQKLVFEDVMSLVRKSNRNHKHVVIVDGAPGTGKTVVAINLLVEATKGRKLVQYVTKNSAPRQVYESKLVGHFKKSEISNFFSGSGNFTDTDSNAFDVLVVDEAHRLNAKSGMFQNLGENQIKELINASRVSVFFIDEDQRVTLKDIGEKEEIRKWATALGANVIETELRSQFRCNGSNGYLAWLDEVLNIRETANTSLDVSDYDFRVFDSPSELHEIIRERNRDTNKARMVAGYCWDWKSKRDSKAMDIVLPEYGYSARWNLGSDGMLWILKPTSVEEVGCIHTCQGLEMEYVGVILGTDLVCRDGHIVTNPANRSTQDKSIHGYKKLMREDPEGGAVLLDKIIKNTYRTLMSRGTKGCYIFSTDEETAEYFKTRKGNAGS